MPRCVRCDGEMDPRAGGLLGRLGLASNDGYECSACGTLLCSDCFKQRTVEFAGTSHDGCPTCPGTLEKR